MLRELRPLIPCDTSSSSTDSGDQTQGPGPPSLPPPPPPGPPNRHPTTLIPKRRAVLVACESCRRRKERCDGRRPTCASCRRREIDCLYATETGDMLEYIRMKTQYGRLRRENEQLLELFDLIGKLPDSDAVEALAYIRGSPDPQAALRHARSARVLMPNPAEHLARGGASTAAASVPADSAQNKRLESLDLNALSNSQIRVHARPWTVVAGDGVVSNLISSFFIWDHSFICPFIDREAFLEDMRHGDIKKARYCSPFLVNAICASRYFTSGPSKSFSAISGQDFGAQFLEEAKKLMDQEMGAAALPTAQGLIFLFTIFAHRGMDRAGMMYRYAAYKMIHSLNLEKKFRNLTDDPSTLRQKQIISKALWGLFCFESIVANVYLQQSLLQPPTIPRCFERYAEVVTPPDSCNVDLFGEPFTSSSRPTAFVPGILNATCDLSEILFEVMSWNVESEETGSSKDTMKRKQLFAKMQQWRSSLPRHMREDVNFTTQTYFLRVYLDELIISILRPLHPQTSFDGQHTTKDLCIEAVSADVSFMEKYVESFTLAEYSCMTMCGLYNAVMTLVSHLDDVKTHDVFVTACRILRRQASDYPMTRFILQAVQALIWSLNMTMPELARPYLEDFELGKEELQDIPMSFAIPQAASIRALLASVTSATTAVNDFTGDEKDDGLDGIEMGVLLSKWSSMSIR